MEKVSIVIPIYKDYCCLLQDEINSLKQCFTVFENRSIYFIGPDNIDYSPYLYLSNIENASKCKRANKIFDNSYFENISGYNMLMLSSAFYKKFEDYEYILIYQTDAWIFRDELDYWCNKNYDYIGAPWVDWPWSTFAAAHHTTFRTILHKLGYKNFNLVGNGGLSLRKTKSFINNLNWFKKAATSCKHNEDYFFSFYITSCNPFFKVPSVDEALKFAFDENPQTCYERCNERLPMGCHAWPKYKDFWRAFITTTS